MLATQRGCSLINCYQDALHAAILYMMHARLRGVLDILAPIEHDSVSSTAAVLAL
jgi:hypothetical protein